MELRELFATFGLEFDQKSVDEAEGGLSKLGAAIQSFGAAIASTVVIQGLTQFVLGVAHAAQEVSNLALRSNVTTTQLQQMNAALTPLGFNLESTSKLFEELNIKAGEAAQGGGPAKLFRDLDVSLEDAQGNMRSGQDLFLAVTDRIALMGDAAERSTALNQLMGEEGRRLAPALSGGTNEIRALVQTMGDLEGITPDVIEQSRQLAANMARLDLVTVSLKNELARELLPTFINGLALLVRWTRGIITVVRESNILKATMVVLGSTLVIWGLATIAAWGPTALLFGGIALAIALVVLIVDDMITLFSGGESVLGDFIDEMYGVGAATDFVDGCKLAWQDLCTWLGEGWQWIQDLSAAISADTSAFTTWADRIDLVSGAIETAQRLWRALKQDLEDADEFLDPLTDILDPMGARVEVEEERQARTRRENGEPEMSDGERSIARLRARVRAGAGQVVTAPTPRASGSSVSVSAPVTSSITIVGNPSQQEIQRVERIVDGVMDQRNREALQSLVPEPS